MPESKGGWTLWLPLHLVYRRSFFSFAVYWFYFHYYCNLLILISWLHCSSWWFFPSLHTSLFSRHVTPLTQWGYHIFPVLSHQSGCLTCCPHFLFGSPSIYNKPTKLTFNQSHSKLLKKHNIRIILIHSLCFYDLLYFTLKDSVKQSKINTVNFRAWSPIIFPAGLAIPKGRWTTQIGRQSIKGERLSIWPVEGIIECD